MMKDRFRVRIVVMKKWRRNNKRITRRYVIPRSFFWSYLDLHFLSPRRVINLATNCENIAWPQRVFQQRWDEDEPVLPRFNWLVSGTSVYHD